MSLPFTMAELEAAVREGYVTRRPHPTLPLDIYNYSPSVQYENRWNDVTLNCRGLILDDDGNIVARPWKKFFNLGQIELPIQFDTPVEIMDKADGSLGILYRSGEGKAAIATRGSFDSYQARHATKLWEEEYAMYHDFNEVIDEYTFLFEIIYPSNRIVLNYGDMDDLILLGAVENKTGHYLSPVHAQSLLGWMGPVVEVMEFNTLSDAIGNMSRKNAEGYVIRSHNFMVKLKQPDYLDLHKLVTNASPKTVWEQLRAGKSKSEVISNFPDEFHDYIGSMIDPLVEQYQFRVTEILDGYHKMNLTLSVHSPRKDRAMKYKQSQDARYYFLLFDNRLINEVLWMELKPRETAIERADRGE